MDYETKYKQALFRARGFCERWDGLDVDSSSLAIKDVKKIFPELAESEDERIRKELIDFVENWKIFNPDSALDDYAIYTSDSGECDKILAWLEKQGKKLDPDKVIAWLVANICDFEYYVKRFKQDFGL